MQDTMEQEMAPEMETPVEIKPAVLKLDPKALAAELGKEGIKNLLKVPEVAKLRLTDPTLVKIDKEQNALDRANEAAADKKELERIAALFATAEEPDRKFPISENITKIDASFKDSSATVYCNFKVNGKATVLRTSVSKQNITEKQYQRRLDAARKWLMVVATYGIELDLDTVEF